MAKRGKVHIVAKFILAYVALAMTLASVFAFIYYNQFSQAALESIRGQAMAIAEGVSNTVDFSGHDTIKTPEDVNSPVHKRIFDDLFFATNLNEQVEFIYTMRPYDEENFEFVVDASLPNDDNENGVIDEDEAVAEVGELYEITCCPELVAGMEGPSADSEAVSDQWGSYISGYAPIYNDADQAIGIVGVDITVDESVRLQQLLQRNVVVTLVATLLLALIFGIVGVLLFNHEERKIRRALEIRNEDLERRVKARTKSLQEFMAVIVHDLKAPLTAMNWGLQSIQESVKKKSTKEELNDMTDIVASMRHLVQTILDASKLSLGKMPIKKKKDDPVKLVNTIVKEFVPVAKNSGIEFTSEVGNLPEFSFDSARITQVLQNLVSNALKFTGKDGSVRVHASYMEDVKKIRIEVTDTGKGISKKDIEKLFTPFMRVGDQKEPGSGLGLSIVRGIVEGHGGQVGVTSTLGKGSTFWFELPTNGASPKASVKEKETPVAKNTPAADEEKAPVAQAPAKKAVKPEAKKKASAKKPVAKSKPKSKKK